MFFKLKGLGEFKGHSKDGVEQDSESPETGEKLKKKAKAKN